MNLTRNIKEICRKKHLTVQEVEKAAGLPKNSIYKWDRNIPAFTKVIAVAAVMDVSLDELSKE